MQVVVQGLTGPDQAPGLERAPEDVVFRFARGAEALSDALAGSEIMFGFDYRRHSLERAWGAAGDLRWIQWAGAGVDALLFDDLVASDVVVTNAAGVFDRPIAEHVLAVMLAMAKGLPRSTRAQTVHEWDYRMTRSVGRTRAVVIGAGGIGRAIARLLQRVDVDVTVLASRTRPDEEFGTIYAWDRRYDHLGSTDWLVLAAPLTEATRNLIDADVLTLLAPTACFINIGRGASVDESALLAALTDGRLAGAALDVFTTEPLPADSPFWDLENVIVTPHHSGDVGDYPQAVVDIFLDNLDRYRSGRPLRNIIDKAKGYGAP